MALPMCTQVRPHARLRLNEQMPYDAHPGCILSRKPRANQQSAVVIETTGRPPYPGVCLATRPEPVFAALIANRSSHDHAMQTEQITITLPSDLAQRFRAATPQQQERARMALARVMMSREEQVRLLEQRMDRMAQTAHERGLTDEVLDELLGDDA